MAGITDMASANVYVNKHYRPAFNLEFMQPAQGPGFTFVPCIGTDPSEILCEHFERIVRHDNCVSFQAMKLQIPQQRHRCHFVKAKVRVRRYVDDTLAIFHGARCLARYRLDGRLIEELNRAVA